MIKRLVLSALILIGMMPYVYAQTTQSRVVSSCGSASYTAGQNAPTTVDTTGAACTNEAGGGGTTPVNITQIGGNAILTGTGATGTGSQRTTTAQDTTTIAGSAPGTAGTPSANVVSIQGVPSGTAVPTSDTIIPTATVGLTTQSCTVACASTIVSGAHGVYGISASATVTGWVLVYDATSCSANGTVTPKKAFAYTVTNASLGISWSDIPMINATGVAVCFSSTGPFSATASTTAMLSLDYK